MDIVSHFLASKFAEYRVQLSSTERCTEFMPYDWLAHPTTVRFGSKFGKQQMVYRDMSSDAARDLANGINQLINMTDRKSVV